jgi:dUTP pyrophosphatase
MSVPVYLTPNIPYLELHKLGIVNRAHDSDAGADLASTDSYTIVPGGVAKVKFGVAVEIPLGHVGLLCSRSGHAKIQVSLANSVGVIDSDYRGELMGFVQNLGHSTFTINPGDRIAQLLVVPIILPKFVKVDVLSNTDRGTGGFGSTNKQ